MMTWIIKIFKYIENMWIGKDGKPSIRRVFAIALIIDFINNTNYAIHKWEIGKSYADVAMLLGIEAGLIAALLTLTTYSTTMFKPPTTEE
jgi:hypothetical protein